MLKGAEAQCIDLQCLDALTGLPVSDGKACDDGRACTAGDSCQAGTCTPGSQQCDCEPGILSCPAPSAGDAVNKCKGPPICLPTAPGAKVPYACLPNASLTKVCDSSLDSPCRKNACVPLSGQCTPTAVERTVELCDVAAGAGGQPGCRREVMAADVADGPLSACDDGLACSVDEACKDGGCGGGDATACKCKADPDCVDDGDLCNGTPFCDTSGATWQCKVNPKTVVSCDVAGDTACLQTSCKPSLGGCKKAPVAAGTSCSDGIACTVGDACDGAGTCQSGTWTCCKSDVDCALKEDGDLCNGTLFCDLAAGACKPNPATVVICPSAQDTTCRKAQCQKVSGQCALVAASDGTPCDDGGACTSGDTCQTGVCHGGTFVCPCATNSDCQAKDDGDLCNGTLYCNKVTGFCQPNPASVVHCQTLDDSACSKTQCLKKSGICQEVQLPASITCDADGTACTANDACDGKGACLAGTGVCICQSDADCAAKEDGDLCNGTLYCDKSGLTPACKINPATLKSCASVDDTACSKVICQAKTGICAMTALTAGAQCDDGLPCTGGDGCDGKGTCKAGTVLVCGCKGDADCAAFDDGDVCNGDHKCQGGGCVLDATPKVCDDGNPCTGDACDKAKGCIALPHSATCSDDDLCTVGDVCGGGKCLPGTAKPCDDGNTCTKDSCDPKVGCLASAINDLACIDGSPCTLGDVCQLGACMAGPEALGMTAAGVSGLGEHLFNAAAFDADSGHIIVVGEGKTPTIGDGKGSAGLAVRLGDDGKGAAGGALGLGAPHSALQDVVSVAKGAFVAAGARGATEMTMQRWLVLLDADAKGTAEFAGGDSPHRSYFAAVALRGPGAVIAAGTSYTPSEGDHGDVLLAAFSVDPAKKSLQLLKERTLASAGGSRGAADVLPRGGGAIVVGSASTGGHTWGFLVEVDAGLRQRRPAFELSTAGVQTRFTAMAARADGGTFVFGGRQSGSDPLNPSFSARPILLAFSLEGLHLWTRELASPTLAGRTFAFGAAPLDDGGLAIVGYTLPAKQTFGAQDLWLGRVDAQGLLGCDAAFAGSGYQSGYGVVAAGSTLVAVGGANGVPLVARASAYCQIDCGQAGACVGKSNVACDDGLPCTTPGCDPKSGSCTQSLHSGVACHDGNVCHALGVCSNGKCTAQDTQWSTEDAVEGVEFVGIVGNGPDGIVAVGMSVGQDVRAIQVAGDSDEAKKWAASAGMSQHAEVGTALAAAADGTFVGVGRRHLGGKAYVGIAYRLDVTSKVAITIEAIGSGGGDQQLQDVVAAGVGSAFAVGHSDVGGAGGGQDGWLVRLGEDMKAAQTWHYGGGAGDAFHAIVSRGPRLGISGVTGVGVAPTGWLMEVTTTGVAVWQRSAGASVGAVELAADDEGYLVTFTRSGGQTSEDPWAVRTDRDGNVIWQRAIVGAKAEYASGVVRDGDGWAVLSYQIDGGTPATLLTGLDAVGTTRWGPVTVAKDAVAYDLVQTLAGFAVAGKRTIGGNSGAWLARTDRFGHTSCVGACLKAAVGGVSGRDCDDGKPCTVDGCDGKGCSHASASAGASCDSSAGCSFATSCDAAGVCTGCAANWDVKLTADASVSVGRALALRDGGTVAVGAKGADTWLGHVDACGNELAQVVLTDKGDDSADSVATTGDGKVWLAGMTYRNEVAGSKTSRDARLLRLSYSSLGGKTTWTKELDVTTGGESWDEYADLVDDGGQGVFAAGIRDAATNLGAAWLVHHGGDGKVVAAYQHQGASYTALNALARRVDGALVGAGAIDFAGASDAWVARFADQGDKLALVWSKRWTSPAGSDVLGAIVPFGAGWAVAGATTPSALGGKRCWLATLDDAGAQAQAKVVAADKEGACDRLAVRHGALLAAGYELNAGVLSAVLVHADAGLQVQWRRSEHGTQPVDTWTRSLGLQSLPGDRWLVAGRRGPADGTVQAWLRVVDAFGAPPCGNDACSSVAAVDCDDDNMCTADACDPAKGCVHDAKAVSACDDGNPCTQDACKPSAGCGHDAKAQDGKTCGTGSPSTCQAGVCGCGPGFEAVTIDNGAGKAQACMALGPVWGNRPAAPKGVYSVKELAGGKVAEDAQTKLMWQQGSAPNKLDWDDARSYCDDLVYAGYNDWRLPSVHELATLVDYGLAPPGPTIDLAAFPDTLQAFYWSATGSASTPLEAWEVRFDSGDIVASDRTIKFPVRCVRANGNHGVSARYQVSVGGGVVTDTWTQLQWQRKVGAAGKSWAQAKNECLGLNLEGGGWRLPEFRELEGLVDYTKANPSIDGEAFPETPSATFRSATLRAESSSNAWIIMFTDGRVASEGLATPYHVRCVRGS